MAGSLRALRRRIRSTQSTKKIFSAQELIAGARIVRAQARVEASKPYAREITRVLSALASSASLDHPLLTERQNPRRAGVLVITSDRGFAGSYNVNVLRRTEELLSQVPVAKRMAPLEVEEVEEFDYEAEDRAAGRTGDSGVPTSYEFEPSAEGLLDALLPKYVTTRIYAAMLEAAASESASRRRAMKSASDNAEELAKNLAR